MTTRKPMSKTLRFEVFKRDNFTCQYCGKTAPEVILHVDHINPVAGGGDNNIMNLITSCEPCNLGKGARTLDDQSALAKQRAQLEELSERREQLEMMLSWREGLANLNDEIVDAFNDAFEAHTKCTLNDVGRKRVKDWLKSYDIKDLLDALDGAVATYFKDGDADPEENNRLAGHAFGMTVRVLSNQRANADKPWMKDLFYIRAIARNRLNYFKSDVAIFLLKDAFAAGVHIEDLKDLAKTARNWTQWRNTMQDWAYGEDAI